MAVKEINTPFVTPIPILIENTFTTFKYSLLTRGYYIYKDVWCRLLTAKSHSARGASHQPALMSSCLTVCQTCLPCQPSVWMRLNIGAWWGREECFVQRLEKGICPRSVLDYGSENKETPKFGTQQ